MSLSCATVERRFTAFDVYLNGKCIDTTYHTGNTVEEQRKSLIGHDGYDSEIEVYGVTGTVIPLTRKEMRTLLEDIDVEVRQDVVNWYWFDEIGASLPFATELEALRDAITAKELDTKGAEDIY
jgi:hypothetical protein